MKICRQGMPFHHLPKYQNPTTLCLGSLCSYPSCFFFNQFVQLLFITWAQSKPLLKSIERSTMAATVSQTGYTSLSPPQLTFLQCHGRHYYENQSSGVNGATEFSSMNLFPSLLICSYWKPSIISNCAWHGWLNFTQILSLVKSVTQTVLPSVNLVSFTSSAYIRVAGILDIFT